MDDIYKQRSEIFQLAMILADKCNYETGVRFDEQDKQKKWPVLFIVLPENKEIAIHSKSEDTNPMIYNTEPSKRKYDGHTDEEKSKRINDYINKEYYKYSFFRVASMLRHV